MKHAIVFTEDNGLSQVLGLRPATFEYNWDKENKTYLGFIAEQAETVNRLFVEYDKEKRPKGMQELGIMAATVQAIKDFHRRLDVAGAGALSPSLKSVYQGKSPAITIDKKGNVGIGSAFPGNDFEVNGSARFTNGHVNTTGGTAPMVSSCGTRRPAVTSGSTDFAGQVRTGNSSPTACTITFGTKYANTPFCVASLAGETSGTIRISSASNTSFTVTLGTGADGNVINWVCVGNRN